METRVQAQQQAHVQSKVRADLARHHLRAAAQAALRTYEIEKAGEAQTLGPGFDEIMTCVPVSISMAAAALEANANELILDVLDGKIETAVMTDAKKVMLCDLLKEESGNALARYYSLSLLRDRVLDKGDNVWSEADLLIKFRNFFMHFKPSWTSADSQPTKSLDTRCQHKFKVAEAYKLNSFYMFPHSCFTYECAKWSVDTVLRFSKFMSKSLDISDRFDKWKPLSGKSLPPVP